MKAERENCAVGDPLAKVQGWPATSITPTFPPYIKPEHVGIYLAQASSPCPKAFSYWDGELWYASSCSIAHALYSYSERRVSVFQNRSWRGLKERTK